MIDKIINFLLHGSTCQELPLKPFVKENPREYHMGGGWGDAINFTDVEKGHVVGWKFYIPVVGDILYVPMKSGRTAKCVFTEVECCYDPSDMFFGKIWQIGWLN